MEIWPDQMKLFLFPLFIKLLLLTKNNCIALLYFDVSKILDLESHYIRIEKYRLRWLKQDCKYV